MHAISMFHLRSKSINISKEDLPNNKMDRCKISEC